MCYTGGPYCSKPAKKAYIKAQNDFMEDPSVENEGKLNKAKKNYFTSPEGIEKLRSSGQIEKADEAQRFRDEGIARAKQKGEAEVDHAGKTIPKPGSLEEARLQEEEQAKFVVNPNTSPNDLHRVIVAGDYHARIGALNNPNASVKSLEYIMKRDESEDDFRFALARHPKSTPEMVDWAAKHPSMRAKELALENPNVSQETIKRVNKEARKEYMDAKEKAKTVSPEQGYYQHKAEQSLRVWKRGRTLLEVPTQGGNRFASSVSEVIDRTGDHKEYYASTDAKHFSGTDSPGSKFTDSRIKNLETLTAVAMNQRGSLDGDDREKLKKFGADPKSFHPDYRYLMVQTPGRVGAQSINSLPVNTKISVERTKVGAPVSLVADVKEQKSTNFGVIIMGKFDGETKESVITAHPGLPARRSESEEFERYEGRKLSVNHVMEIAGYENVNVNTRLK